MACDYCAWGPGGQKNKLYGTTLWYLLFLLHAVGALCFDLLLCADRSGTGAGTGSSTACGLGFRHGLDLTRRGKRKDKDHEKKPS